MKKSFHEKLKSTLKNISKKLENTYFKCYKFIQPYNIKIEEYKKGKYILLLFWLIIIPTLILIPLNFVLLRYVLIPIFSDKTTVIYYLIYPIIIEIICIDCLFKKIQKKSILLIWIIVIPLIFLSPYLVNFTSTNIDKLQWCLYKIWVLSPPCLEGNIDECKTRQDEYLKLDYSVCDIQLFNF